MQDFSLGPGPGKKNSLTLYEFIAVCFDEMI